MQTRMHSIYEAWANTILGLVISQGVLMLFNVPADKAATMAIVMVLISTLRNYVVRRIFNRMGTSG
jgi:uncharacterized membrane protein